MTAIAAPRRLTGRAVLAMLLAFFGLVAGVNAIFIVVALRSFSGVSTVGAYQRGLAWNRELAAAVAQRAQGWRAQIEAVRTDDDVRLRATLADAAGLPLDGLVVRAELRRPTSQGHDASIQLAAEGSGRYGAAVALSLRGQWNLRLEAAGLDGATHVVEERLWLP